MSLLFDASTEKVDHGSDASLDNLDPWSFAGWVYPTTLGTSNRGYWGKGNDFCTVSSPAGQGGSGTLRFRVVHATTPFDVRSDSGTMTTDTWQFVAGTYDTAASPEGHLYRGTLTTTVAEVSYQLQQNSSGAHNTNAASSILAGQIGADANNLLGRAGSLCHFTSVLSLGDLRIMQFGGPSALMANCVLYGEYIFPSGGTQPDLSGNIANNGTVTGATNAPHTPIALPWEDGDPDWEGAFTAAAAAAALHMIGGEGPSLNWMGG